MKRKHYILLAVLTVVAGLIYPFTGVSAYLLVFSPDGKYLASGSGWDDDYAVRLWDIDAGCEVQSFYGHTESVTSVAFSPDGKYILSGAYDHTAKKWDVSSGHGQLVSSIEISNDWADMAFSPDGQYVLSYSPVVNILTLREISTGRSIRSFPGDYGIIVSLAFSPDGKHFLSINKTETMILWDTDTGQEIRSFKGPGISRGSKPAFSPDGNYILSGSWNGQITLWDVNTGELVTHFSPHVRYIHEVVFSPDGRYAISGGSDKLGSEKEALTLWDLSTGIEIRSFHVTFVEAIAFSPDGRYIAANVWEGNVCIQLWEVTTGRLVKSFPVNKYLMGKPRYKVTKIIDGDTVGLMMNGKPIIVRMIGVDTPKTVHTQKTIGHYEAEALEFTKNLLNGEWVYVERDPWQTVDTYGHELLYLYRAPYGLFVNLEIIRQGYGRSWKTYNYVRRNSFKYYENRAKASEKGVWAQTIKDDLTVYYTQHGAKYHRGGCRNLRKSKFPIKLSEARKQYEICKHCNPPR